jgi:hypothetical protein
MKYIIVSELVGTVGAEYVPAEGINVEALLDGGFIKVAPKSIKQEQSED